MTDMAGRHRCGITGRLVVAVAPAANDDEALRIAGSDIAFIGEARDQLRFERAIARELAGESDL